MDVMPVRNSRSRTLRTNPDFVLRARDFRFRFFAVMPWILGGLLAMGLAGCSSPKSGTPSPEFRSTWLEAWLGGVDFRHESAPAGKYQYHRVMGSGVALLDVNQDDRLDVFCLTNAGPGSASTHRLFVQQPDGRLSDATQDWGLATGGWGQGVVAGDIDNDGRMDLCLTETNRTRLFWNRGDHFEELDPRQGVVNPNWGLSAAFADFDRDGWLDLVVGNYLESATDRECTNLGGGADFCGPHHFAATASRLFRNLGPDAEGRPRFVDQTVAAGWAFHPGKAMGVWCDDFDGDGWCDVFLANDSIPNTLFINQQDGTFREEGLSRGVAVSGMGQPEANMGVAVGDADGDGLFDLFVTHLVSEEHRLWRQNPVGLFTDNTARARLSWGVARGTGFGTCFADLDNDGDHDLVVAQGAVLRERRPADEASASDFWSGYRQHNLLLENVQGTFVDASGSNPAFCGEPGVYRGLACGDLDGDGGLDLVVSQIDGPPRVLRNAARDRGHWLAIRAVDPRWRRDALGAVVRLVGMPRGRVFRQTVQTGGSYGSSGPPWVHFGLGTNSGVTACEITWPDGAVETFPVTQTDCRLELRRGSGATTP